MTTTATQPRTPALQAAQEAIPAVAEIDKTLALLKDVPRPAKASAGVLLQTVAASLRSGEPVPSDLAEQIDAIEREKHLVGVHGRAIHGLRTVLKEQREDAVSSGLDGAFAYLGKQLDELMAEARRAAPLVEGVPSANAAVLSGPAVADAWRILAALSDKYIDIRTAQKRLLLRYRTREFGSTAEIRGLDEIWIDDGEPPYMPPWPHQRHSSGEFLVPAWGIDYLIWLASEPRAMPWVPTLTELDEENARVANRLDAVRASRRDPDRVVPRPRRGKAFAGIDLDPIRTYSGGSGNGAA